MDSSLNPKLISRDKELFKLYAEQVTKTGKKINYGTAGFRCEAKLLDLVNIQPYFPQIRSLFDAEYF
jgi:hypothetical protein